MIAPRDFAIMLVTSWMSFALLLVVRRQLGCDCTRVAKKAAAEANARAAAATIALAEARDELGRMRQALREAEHKARNEHQEALLKGQLAERRANQRAGVLSTWVRGIAGNAMAPSWLRVQAGELLEEVGDGPG